MTKKISKKHAGKESTIMVWVLAVAAILLLVNQWQISSVATMLSTSTSTGTMTTSLYTGSSGDVDDVDVTSIQSTAQAIAALFPVDEIKSADDAMKMMVPRGTPPYGEAMGVSYDDPITSLDRLGLWYRKLINEVSPEVKQRFIALASKPRGVSCEYCCGVGPIGATKDGQSRCGCKHNPAVLGLTLWLMQNTDMGDAEILREVMKWKTLFFPRNMVGLALQIAGGDSTVLQDVPGMVGGC